MGKKCIPGLFCIENMTLLILVIIMLIVVYLYYAQFMKYSHQNTVQPTYILLPTPHSVYTDTYLKTMDSKNAPMTDIYSPPLKNDMFFRKDSTDVRGVPSTPFCVENAQMATLPFLIPTNKMSGNEKRCNIETRGTNAPYEQIGILTGNGNGYELILPLMARQLTTGSYKWQYYTMTATGNMNTKLPISINGKSCTSEYGCDSLSNGDVVYVEGYKDTFQVTLYENSLFRYLPY